MINYIDNDKNKGMLFDYKKIRKEYHVLSIDL